MKATAAMPRICRTPRNVDEIDQLGRLMYGPKRWDKHRARLDLEACKRRERDKAATNRADAR